MPQEPLIPFISELDDRIRACGTSEVMWALLFEDLLTGAFADSFPLDVAELTHGTDDPTRAAALHELAELFAASGSATTEPIARGRFRIEMPGGSSRVMAGAINGGPAVCADPSCDVVGGVVLVSLRTLETRNRPRGTPIPAPADRYCVYATSCDPPGVLGICWDSTIFDSPFPADVPTSLVHSLRKVTTKSQL